jgi:hypothetical protein
MFDLNALPRLLAQSLRNPREGAATILSMRPPRAALWMLLALVAVVSTLMSQLATLVFVGQISADAVGSFGLSPLAMAGLQAFFVVVMVYVTFWASRAAGGTGSFDETFLIVVWLQIVLVAFQILQLLLLPVSPAIATLVGFVTIGMFFYLLTNFLMALHNFRSAGMVLAGIVMTAFGVMFLMGIAMTVLGLAPEMPQ